MDKSFWKDKKVMITGHTGFKGSWLSIWLKRIGANVVGYSLPPPTNPSLFEIANVNRGITSIEGDIRNFEYLKSTIDRYRPEIIIHMAAQALVRYGYENPLETYSTNVMGTVNILESVRQVNGVRVLVIVTSDKCYDNKEWCWGYRENDTLGGRDPYSSSKACAEMVTTAYCKSYFSHNDVAIASVRAGNVIGGGDWSEDRLIPDIMKAFMEHRPVIIRSPQSIRPWQYVLDPLYGYLLLAERLWSNGQEYAGGWNFGPPKEDAKPVSWIVEEIKKMWGDDASWELDNYSGNPKEALCLKLDCSKAKHLLGWSPNLNLHIALKWIVDWYRAYMQNENMQKYSNDEIIRYENILAVKGGHELHKV
ncbi:MAG: CDP-glucose 4,6-dehydratase [Nitrospirae bacterium]|nr:CDP-glucose 4,6-dehydratase [Nitrospirota bacterium]